VEIDIVYFDGFSHDSIVFKKDKKVPGSNERFPATDDPGIPFPGRLICY
jgi:hypothetical protein